MVVKIWLRLFFVQNHIYYGTFPLYYLPIIGMLSSGLTRGLGFLCLMQAMGIWLCKLFIIYIYVVVIYGNAYVPHRKQLDGAHLGSY